MKQKQIDTTALTPEVKNEAGAEAVGSPQEFGAVESSEELTKPVERVRGETLLSAEVPGQPLEPKTLDQKVVGGRHARGAWRLFMFGIGTIAAFLFGIAKVLAIVTAGALAFFGGIAAILAKLGEDAAAFFVVDAILPGLGTILALGIITVVTLATFFAFLFRRSKTSGFGRGHGSVAN